MASFLTYNPSGEDFWEVEMAERLRKHGAVIYMDEMNNHHIRGDGIRLGLPFDWLVMCPADDLVARVIQGIEVSLDHQKRLGY